MHRPLATVLSVYCFGSAPLNEWAQPGSAVSSEASAIRHLAVGLMKFGERSQSLFGAKAIALSSLNTLANECSAPGWDGHDASAIESIALHQAEALVRALPDGVPMPEFAPEPDGSISLDWIESRNRVFSISIGRSHRLAYAWLDGTDKGHAVARFDGSKIPPRLLEAIRSFGRDANAFFRAA